MGLPTSDEIKKKEVRMALSTPCFSFKLIDVALFSLVWLYEESGALHEGAPRDGLQSYCPMSRCLHDVFARRLRLFSVKSACARPIWTGYIARVHRLARACRASGSSRMGACEANSERGSSSASRQASRTPPGARAARASRHGFSRPAALLRPNPLTVHPPPPSLPSDSLW